MHGNENNITGEKQMDRLNKKFYLQITQNMLDRFKRIKEKTGVPEDAALARAMWIFGLEYLEVDMLKPNAKFFYTPNGQLKVIEEKREVQD